MLFVEEYILIVQRFFFRLEEFLFLAPEMLKKEGVTMARDLNRFCVVLSKILIGFSPNFNDNIKFLYQNIKQRKLKLQKYLSTVVRNFLIKMLNRNPA